MKPWMLYPSGSRNAIHINSNTGRSPVRMRRVLALSSCWPRGRPAAHARRRYARPASSSTASATAAVAVVGVGKMGAAMATNFLAAGMPVVVYDKHDREAVQALERQGAKAAADLREVARLASTVVTMLPNDDVLASVSGKLLPHLRPGALHISCSTVGPATSRALAQAHAVRQVRFVGAPAFARPDGVARKEAYFVVGASDAAAVAEAKPILLATGSQVFEFSSSDPGAGNVVKLCGNYLIAAAIESIAESLALAESQGLDREEVMRMLSATIFDCLIYRGYGQRIAQRDHRPGGFSLELGYKDVGLVRETARQSGVPMPFGSVLHDRFLASYRRGGGDLDWSAVALDVSRDAGVALEEEDGCEGDGRWRLAEKAKGKKQEN